MSRIRQTVGQKDGKQMPQGAKVFAESKASPQGSMSGKKKKGNPRHK